MDLQNLQYYLSEEQLPLCIMDERDDGIRLFFFIYIYQTTKSCSDLNGERRLVVCV